MGNYISQSKEEWVKESLFTIKLKFNNKEIVENNKNIEWDYIEKLLNILYEHKYNNLDITELLPTLSYDPRELDYYI
jgi:hypothetical protein